MSDFFDITTYHVLQVTFGPSGWFECAHFLFLQEDERLTFRFRCRGGCSYVITNAQTNEQLLETQHSGECSIFSPVIHAGSTVADWASRGTSAGNWTDGYVGILNYHQSEQGAQNSWLQVKHGIYRDYGTSLTPVE